jgi:putative ABC transport system ATP-binding protein
LAVPAAARGLLAAGEGFLAADNEIEKGMITIQRMEKEIIVCKDIKKAYGAGETEVVVLKGITFSIKRGEFVAIMGPSGSGKSTLMHILGALDTPTSGKYFLEDRDVSKLSEDELADIRREKIGFVFQSFNLLPRTTVLRNVSLPLIYANMPKEEREKIAAKALIDAAFPEEFWSYHSNQISGGMMQRVAIARALVNDPTLILADEPTGNLDSKTGEIVLHTFQNLNMEQGKTIVLITHEPYVAEHADRIIHIRDGDILTDEKNKNKRVARNEKNIPHDNT